MKIAVFSDVHSNLAALEAVLADIERRQIIDLLNLGDSLSGPFSPRETADRLLGLDIPAVAGNHDRLLVETPRTEMGLWETWAADELEPRHLDWLASWPKTFERDGVLFCHATPGDDAENWLDRRGPEQRLVMRDLEEVRGRLDSTSAEVIVCGHTHTPRVVRIPDGPLVVNVGSVGCPAYLDTRVEPNFIHQTGAPDARYAVIEKRNGIWAAELIAVPYDASEMARLARRRGADSFARAVETGWLS
ncbi:MAG: metallophosphoesterase family protein [Pseudomonadota bacterium]